MALAMFFGALGQLDFVLSALARTGADAVEREPSKLGSLLAFLGYAVPSLAAILAFPIPPDPLISRFRRDSTSW